MASNFPTYVTMKEDEGSYVQDYAPSQVAGQTCVVGDLCYWDDTNNVIRRCGADPAAITGLCEVDSEQARVLTASGRIPIRVISPTAIFCMCSTTTPVEATHVGQVYGIARNASGNWEVDVSDTTNTKVFVVRVDVIGTQEIWYVRFLAASLTDDAIAS